jgi:hypothetical protein
MAVKTLFTIGKVSEDSTALLLEVGGDHCCYAFLNENKKTFDGVKYIAFNEQDGELSMREILSEIEIIPGKVVISSAYAEALLVPRKLFNEQHNILGVVYDGNNRTELHDTIPEWQMTAAYSLPHNIYQQLVSKFPSAKFYHVYTPSLKIYNGFVAEDQVDLSFSTQQFRVLVKKENIVLLAQTYSYKTPLDVVYYLLKICYEFGLRQEHVFVIISGLIDKDSALYSELHNYFLNIHFAHPAPFSLPESDLPHYYFSSLYNLAACAL